MMQINKNWKIEADPLNVTLYQRHKKKDGAYTWLAAGFFSNVQNALHELVEHKVRETKLADLKAVNSAIKELHDMIDNLQTDYQSNPKTLQRVRSALKPSVGTPRKVGVK